MTVGRKVVAAIVMIFASLVCLLGADLAPARVIEGKDRPLGAYVKITIIFAPEPDRA